MENKINIAETLKDCHKGTKLYSPIFGDVYLEKIRPHLAVVVTTESNDKEEFLYDGRYDINGEYCIFPSNENRDWSTFKRPFEDGDILFVKAAYSWIFIYKESENKENLYRYVAILKHPNHKRIVHDNYPLCCKKDVSEIRPATEEEKAKLFQAIKDNGYKWNAETKTLEKLVEPRFKVGDRIKHKLTGDVYKIMFVLSNGYGGGVYDVAITNEIGKSIEIEEQDNYELDKFDITTLKPFDKVLVRDNNAQKWTADLFSFFDKSHLSHLPQYICVGHYTDQCIPYEGNEHLLGTTNDCDDYYKTWEE